MRDIDTCKEARLNVINSHADNDSKFAHPLNLDSLCGLYKTQVEATLEAARLGENNDFDIFTFKTVVINILQYFLKNPFFPQS